jgi:heterodisulfide reductase subunit B
LAGRGFGPYNIPVIDLGQLIALAMGMPVGKLGFNANTVSLGGVLNILGIGEDKP